MREKDQKRMGMGERSKNRNGMETGKEEMEKIGQDTWRTGKARRSENRDGERIDEKNRARGRGKIMGRGKENMQKRRFEG